ncbi:hypothetical protein TIFTF001_015173 [Ficus carica]|uniref:Uncharacterized protein n=1 Tax=Ficus carica TaxID=3494 RepID=A0AA88D8Q0_FICCA|nr:hypothetical protein TIFTF001_015173 [Ficus carica]
MSILCHRFAFLQGTQEDSPSSNCCSLKMSSFAAKLVALLLLLDIGVNLVTSTLPPYGDRRRPSSHVFDCRGVLRRITARKEGNFGCENVEVVEHKPVPSRSLRVFLSSPPSPIQNGRQGMTNPPPPIA